MNARRKYRRACPPRWWRDYDSYCRSQQRASAGQLMKMMCGIVLFAVVVCADLVDDQFDRWRR